MRKQLALGLATAVCALGATVLAGDEHGAEKPKMFTIYKETVKPGMTQQYEQGLEYMISEFKAYQVDPEKVNWFTVSGTEMGYVFVMPIDSWADLDKMKDNWMTIAEKMGEEKFAALMAPLEECLESVDIFQSIHREDLSYKPENPRLKGDEMEFIHYGFYYAIPGKGAELEAIAKQFKELYEAKGIDTGWSMYQTISGSDLPLYVVAHAAKSAADYYANRERIKELLGPEAKKLGEKVGETVRKIEYKEAAPRPELSYPDPREMAEYEEADEHAGHDHD